MKKTIVNYFNNSFKRLHHQTKIQHLRKAFQSQLNNLKAKLNTYQERQTQRQFQLTYLPSLQ